MQGILYEEPSFWLFVLVTVVMGGWAAWMTGRAMAITWRPYWQLVVYLLILAAAVRFIHFALFEGTLMSHPVLSRSTPSSCSVIGSLGFRYYRARQMATQYRWLYERTGPFSWRERTVQPKRLMLAKSGVTSDEKSGMMAPGRRAIPAEPGRFRPYKTTPEE